jgi:hypothetical protein
MIHHSWNLEAEQLLLYMSYVGPVESFQEKKAFGMLTVPELDQVSNDMID